MARSDRLVISIGGSVIHSNKPDFNFMEKFAELVRKDNRKFIVFTGGGTLSREFQRIASENMEADSALLDELGIVATKVNALLLKSVLGDIAYPDLITEPSQKVNAKIAVGMGWKPGFSTDHCAVKSAIANNVNTVINISNISHVHDKDPRMHKDAKPMEKVSWRQMRKIVGDKWIPGMNTPFDPEATKLASENRIKVVFLGPNISNIKAYLAGKKFEGTIIS